VAAPAAATATAAAPALTFPGVALSGTIQAVGSKVTGSHKLNFKEWKGSFEAKDGKAEGGKLELQVQVGSLEEVVEKRSEWVDKFEGHMKSPDFFDVAQFATASFQSTEIKAGGDAAAAGSTHTIKGNLTLRNVTKEVTFPATVALAGKAVTAKAEFSINRSDFGMKFPGKPDDLIREGVVLQIDVKATLP
jgi:polyisoprenoid-binding protein YceI